MMLKAPSDTAFLINKDIFLRKKDSGHTPLVILNWPLSHKEGHLSVGADGTHLARKRVEGLGGMGGGGSRCLPELAAQLDAESGLDVETSQTPPILGALVSLECQPPLMARS